MESNDSALTEELRKLKLETERQANIISTLQCQVAHKNGEIEKLQKARDESLLASNDFCCNCQRLKCKVEKLEVQLVETVEKQHEAMIRAVQLAEENRNLERELKKTDGIKTAVEEECQTRVKQNTRGVITFQEEICEKISRIDSLQREIENLESRLDKEKLTVETLKLEKTSLQKCLEDLMDENKRLNRKINRYVKRERNLRTESSQLQEPDKSLQSQPNGIDKSPGGSPGTSSEDDDIFISEEEESDQELRAMRELQEELYFRSSVFAEEIEFPPKKRAAERNWQMNGASEAKSETDRKRNSFPCSRCGQRHNCCHPNQSDLDEDLRQKLDEMRKELELLRYENFSLKREKDLDSGLENDSPYFTPEDSLQTLIDTLERERDLALSDVSRLTVERDILKEKIKFSTESHNAEISRMERSLSESEEKIRRLESDRHHLISGQASQRETLCILEQKCNDYRNQISSLENELSRTSSLYNQLKLLHKETNRSSAGAHGRLLHAKAGLDATHIRIQELENENRQLEQKLSILKREGCALRLAAICNDRQKDHLSQSLDEKTELCLKLQTEMKNKDKYIAELNGKLSDLQKNMNIILYNKNLKDHDIINLEKNIHRLREALEERENEKEALETENKRLQGDIKSAVKDCQLAKSQLDKEKEEVENLKRQLQQYVNEVKRAEELLSQKESERNEMLDRFRNLSIEATALESNNHTLESAMETTKGELLAANNRLVNLEQEVLAKESLVNSYENQIADLTARVAELEWKLKQESEEKYRIEEDLAALRSLCSTIDGQKENLKKQANDSDAEKLHLMNEIQRLNEECEGLNHKLVQEHTLAETLEKALSNSRQETLEQKISNKDLQSQVQQLKQKVDELTLKLESESQTVKKYQSQCAELSCQVSDLKREVTNARYEKAKALDASRRHSLVANCNGTSDEVECHGIQESPFRDIPPLLFLEDSDRTVSDEEEISLSCKPRITFLSPVLEKTEKSKWLDCEGKSSDLSSLPEDYFSRVKALPEENDVACDLESSEIHKRCYECAGYNDGRCLREDSLSLSKHYMRVSSVDVNDSFKSGQVGCTCVEPDSAVEERGFGNYFLMRKTNTQSVDNDRNFCRKRASFFPCSRCKNRDSSPNGIIHLNGESVTDMFSRYHEDVDETTYSIINENGSIL